METGLYSLFNNNYTLKTFYNDYPEFNYYDYRNSKLEQFEGFSEKKVIDYWINNDRDYIFSNENVYSQKDIIFFLHMPFSDTNGGVIVQYLLASELDKKGIRVRIKNIFDNNAPNYLFNNFFEDDIDISQSIVIYCEGIVGNPLNAPYVVRWMLSELGKNVPYDYLNYWGKNELVYFFNSETRFYKESNYDGKFKLLTTFYLNDKIKILNYETRNTSCYTYRKSWIYPINTERVFPPGSIEITYHTSFDECIEIFNKSNFFYCYDPLTFLQIISIYCGCICIVMPMAHVSKKEWYQKTGMYEYMKYNNIIDINGIAYGDSKEEIIRAKNTIHLAPQQIKDIEQWNKNVQFKSFIDDINNWDNNKNTINNIYFHNMSLSEFNSPDKLNTHFYREFYDDIKNRNFTDDDIYYHYLNFGIKEGRLTCEDHFFALHNGFDLEFYSNYYGDMKSLNKYKIMAHYHKIGKYEGRKIKEIKILNYDFYRAFYTDISSRNFNNDDIQFHYDNYGKSEGRITCEEHFFDLYPNFNLENYISIHPELALLDKYSILRHYHNEETIK